MSSWHQQSLYEDAFVVQPRGTALLADLEDPGTIPRL